jgi:hypothetical protein
MFRAAEVDALFRLLGSPAVMAIMQAVDMSRVPPELRHDVEGVGKRTLGTTAEPTC